MSDIKTLDFYCYPQGNAELTPVPIKIPKNCCGIDITSGTVFLGADQLWTYCEKHMTTYKDIWQNFAVRKYGLYYGVMNPLGINCTLCNLRNDQAEGNQEDGSYICYSCRKGY